VFPTWFMGMLDERRIILASYASDIARKQGRRARQIVRSRKFSSIWGGTTISQETSAADEWALTNGSEFMAGGILSGVTGNRAHGLVIDDPVAGRQEADSETTRKNTRAAYEDDLLTRLTPDAWQMLVQTRWHQDDLAGGILPANWKGESGDIACRDGQTWRVLALPAEARENDPLGRAPGELLWKEWFTATHFSRYKVNARTWSALFQQLPTPDEGDYFKAEWLRYFETPPDRLTLNVYGASDYAVTADGGDYTVHVVVGIDADERLWLLDLWREQASSDQWVEAFCDLVVKWKPIGWAEESGQIKAGVGPWLTKRQRERKAFVAREQFPTRGDKGVRAQSIRGRMALQGLYVPHSASWKADLVSEIVAFPASVHDDQVDALGLVGQLIDKMFKNTAPKADTQKNLTGYTSKHDGGATPGDWQTY
jgi:predicted phage terminase large subunit-like protein